MPRQSSIDNFFGKSKASSSQLTLTLKNRDKEMSNTDENNLKCKRRNLSLIKPSTPTKSPKLSAYDKHIGDVVNLVSDDEDTASNSSMKPCVDQSQCSNESDGTVSDASMRTIMYSLTPKNAEKMLETIPTPSKSSQTSLSSPQTPVNAVSTPIQHISSPRSREKFFSPIKNRSVIKRTPGKVKRNLSMELSKTETCGVDNDVFTEACQDVDFKTIFLLTIINKYLNDSSLRCLLGSESQELLSKCLHVIKPGMRLVCRLYWRKEGWYKTKQVNQISCEGKDKVLLDDLSLEVMMESLVESGLIIKADQNSMSFDDFRSVLNRDELMQICKDLKIKTSSKENAIEALARFSKCTSNITSYLTGCKSNNMNRVFQIMNTTAGACYKLSKLARSTLYKLHILMHLGMDYSIIRDKKLELTLLYDQVGRETYPIDKNMELDNASVVFGSEDEFERYMTAHNIYEDFLTRTEVAEKCTIVQNVYGLYKNIGHEEMTRYQSLPVWLRRYTPAYKYVKILEAGIQDLKKDKDGGHFLLALDILSMLINQSAFRQHRKAEWYAEKALILHSLLFRYDEAAEVLLEGFNSSMSDEAKDAMRPRALKIARQKTTTLSQPLRAELLQHASKETILESSLGGDHFIKQPMDRSGKRGKVKFETRTVEGRMVQEAEEFCIGQYIADGTFTDGEHWEGRIVSTIFFLLFWDIIYSRPAGARGVFLSHHQLFPLDLFCEGFYANRRKAIDDWLEAIGRSSEEKLLNIMHDTWNKRPETELSGISRLGWDNVRMVSACLGPRGLAAVCRRLARGYQYAHSGFPDLTLWNRYTKHIKFVEVKTDSDKPSMKQIQWMHYLRENDIDTGFCYLGVNTTRQRCRAVHRPDSTQGTNKRNTKEPQKSIKREQKENVKRVRKPRIKKVKKEKTDEDQDANEVKLEKTVVTEPGMEPKSGELEPKFEVLEPKLRELEPNVGDNSMQSDVEIVEVPIDIVNVDSEESHTEPLHPVITQVKTES